MYQQKKASQIFFWVKSDGKELPLLAVECSGERKGGMSTPTLFLSSL
jgi:hypothetical protein